MIEDDALVVVAVAVTVTVVGLMLVAVDVSNDGDTAFSVIFVDGDDVVVVVAAIFDDLGLFQSPKRLQAFFHLH